jgi:hypothetical protein
MQGSWWQALLCLPPAFMLVSSTLKKKATSSSETSVNSQWATWRCIPQAGQQISLSKIWLENKRFCNEPKVTALL